MCKKATGTYNANDTKYIPVTAKTSGSGANSKNGKHVWIGAAYITLGVVLLAYLGFGVLLTFSSHTGPLTRALTTLFFYPAASVAVPGYLGWFLAGLLLPIVVLAGLLKIAYYNTDGRKLSRNKWIAIITALVVASLLQYWLPPVSQGYVSYHAFLDRIATFDKIQAKQKELNPQTPMEDKDATASRSLNQLIGADLMQQEAARYNVHVSAKEVSDTYKSQADKVQGEANLKKQLNDFLGWSPERFKREIRLQLLQDKLNTKLATDDKLNTDRKKKAEAFLKRVKGGEDFATVAKESDDPTAPTGGDQGAIKKGENDPAIEAVAFKLENGQISDIIKTERGYVIIKLDEKTADSVKLHQILVRTKSLNEFFPDELKNAKVSVFVHGLIWDKTLYAVQPAKSTKQPATNPSPEASPVPSAPAAPAQ